MKIAIDCRYLGKSGIGRVCEGILDVLDFTAHEYYLIGKPALLAKYPAKVVADLTDPYSPAGLRSFDKKLNKICDALFIPNFLVPFGVKLPIYTVMHDLIFLDRKETTRGLADRLIKKTLLKRCMKRSRAVSCISQFTYGRCRHYYGKLADKCFVNYNGIPKSVLEYARTHRPAEKEDCFVFVGNVKRHKGLKTLLSAFAAYGKGTLKIIGEKEGFLTGLDLDETAYRNVIFTGRLPDEEMLGEIARAKYLILPSLYEGFGLPPLEALVLGTQAIVSDIPVFREVYGGLPVKYFRSEEELSALLGSCPDSISCREEIAARYDFRKSFANILSHIQS